MVCLCTAVEPASNWALEMRSQRGSVTHKHTHTIHHAIIIIIIVSDVTCVNVVEWLSQASAGDNEARRGSDYHLANVLPSYCHEDPNI